LAIGLGHQALGQGGRPRSAAVADAKQVAMAQARFNDKTNSIAEICKTLRISRATLYRYVQVGR
jgi:DNA invertase Pin-like site-specific DNA recombinase